MLLAQYLWTVQKCFQTPFKKIFNYLMKYFCGFVSLPTLQLTQPQVGVKTGLFLYGANEFLCSLGMAKI